MATNPQLFVSYNCGSFYSEHRCNVADMPTAIREFERQHLRWYLENDRGDIVGITSIHQSTIAMLSALNPQK